MKSLRALTIPYWLAAIIAVTLCPGMALAAEEPLHGEALLIWGTNDAQSPNPKHIPVDSELAKKLGKSPYRWKYYFQVERKLLEVPAGETKKNITMSEHCTLDVGNLGTNRVEVKLYGNGKLVSANKETLNENCTLILAGPAGNETAWLVVIRKIKPAK